MNALIPCWRPFGTIQRMPRMTSCSRGDVVLVKFVFADEKGAKQRPGLIVSIDRYHQGRRDDPGGDHKQRWAAVGGRLQDQRLARVRTPISLNRHRHRQDDQRGHDSRQAGWASRPGAAYGRGQTSGDLGALTLLGIMGRRTVGTIAGNALRQSREWLEARLGKS